MEAADTPALLLLDLPPSAFAGIDLLSFTVTARFRGVKHLPPGFHFAFAGTSTAFSERHGIWFRIPSRTESTTTPLFVVKWDAKAETLVAETDEAEKLRWRANLGSIWREGLTPYRQTSTTRTPSTDEPEPAEEEVIDWPILTSSITAALLSRITNGNATQWHLTSASSAALDISDIPGLDSNDIKALQADGLELNFLPINLKQTWPADSTGRARTEAAQDRSWYLSHIISQNCTDRDPKEVLGELQFCFLMILTLNNVSCLEQWKRILNLIFTCKATGVAENSDFFVQAIAAVRLQLQHCKDAEGEGGGGLIDLADEAGSLLKYLLVRFRKGLEGGGMTTGTGIQDVMDELDDLEEYLRRDHGWQFGGDFARSGVLELEDGEQVFQVESTVYDEDDETGEFAPQIVDLTEEQARLLGVTAQDTRDLGLMVGRTRLGDDDEVRQQVVDSDDQSEESEDEGEQTVAGSAKAEEGSDEEEEMQDLDEMDSRF